MHKVLSLRRTAFYGLVCALSAASAFISFATAQDRYPVVFAHGIGVPAALYEDAVPLKRLFREHGYELYVARTPVAGSLEERAKILFDEIRRLVPNGKFHLIGHSMGGLDARLAVHKYGLASRCASLTTLASPHHGSQVADFVIRNLDSSGQKSRVVRAVLKLFQNDLRPVRDLTSERMEQTFNSRVGNEPGVRYYSMGFYIPEPVERHSLMPVLWLFHSITREGGGGPNDGFVSVESARWGESLGTFAADHWSETAPVPFLGGPTYREVFSRVIERLDDDFR